MLLYSADRTPPFVSRSGPALGVSERLEKAFRLIDIIPQKQPKVNIKHQTNFRISTHTLQKIPIFLQLPLQDRNNRFTVSARDEAARKCPPCGGFVAGFDEEITQPKVGLNGFPIPFGFLGSVHLITISYSVSPSKRKKHPVTIGGALPLFSTI